VSGPGRGCFVAFDPGVVGSVCLLVVVIRHWFLDARLTAPGGAVVVLVPGNCVRLSTARRTARRALTSTFSAAALAAASVRMIRSVVGSTAPAVWIRREVTPVKVIALAGAHWWRIATISDR
jgi:hypothetical protein